MKEIEIGELFREKLSNIQGAPPTDGWQKIRKTAAVKKVTRQFRVRRALWIATAALAVVGVVLLGIISQKSPEKTSPIVNTKEIPSHSNVHIADVERVEGNTDLPSLQQQTTKSSLAVAAADSAVRHESLVNNTVIKEEKNLPSENTIPLQSDSESAKITENHKNASESALMDEGKHSPNQNECKTDGLKMDLRFSTDTAVCKSSMVTLFVDNASDVIWSTGTHANTLTVYPDEPITLYAQVQRVDKTDTVIYFQIDVFDCNLFIPSAFTPNGDGLNDEFIVYSPMEISHYECTIFDKSSRVLFQTKSIQQGWNGTSDGKLLPTGGYFYIIKYRDRMNEQHIQKGQVVLVR